MVTWPDHISFCGDNRRLGRLNDRQSYLEIVPFDLRVLRPLMRLHAR
jgi:hypothetical protein